MYRDFKKGILRKPLEVPSYERLSAATAVAFITSTVWVQKTQAEEAPGVSLANWAWGPRTGLNPYSKWANEKKESQKRPE